MYKHMDLVFSDCSKFSIIFFLKKTKFWDNSLLIFTILGKKLGSDVICSSIVNEVIRTILNLFYLFFFTRRFHTHKKHKKRTSEQKQKRQYFHAHKKRLGGRKSLV